MTKLFALTIAVTLLWGVSFAAYAGPKGSESSSKAWNAESTCSRNAWKKYPDYTTEAAAKRDAETNACRKAKGLKPLEPFPQQPTPPPAQ